MNIVSTSNDRFGARLGAAFCLLVTLVLLSGRLPYRGLRHDGILYMGQALAHIYPRWAASDLFFAHGSQDRYSVFSTGVAWLLQHFDAATVNMTLLRTSWVIWVAALVGLAREFAPRERWLGVLAVVGSSHFYGTSRIFSFMEPFVTARTWAEPVALVALVCLIRGRFVLATLSFVAAMLLHPLVAVPVGAVGLVYLISLDRRWAALLLLSIPVTGLALLGVSPFAALLTTYDRDWFFATVWANNIVYLSDWHITDVVAAVTSVTVLWLACRGSTTSIARAGRAAAIVVPIFMVVSFVGADLMHNVLITQLQLWRVFWIVDLLALLSLPHLLVREWHKGPNGRLAVVATFIAVFAMDAWLQTGWILVCWAALTLVLNARNVAVRPSIINMATAATGLVGLGVLGLQVLDAFQQMSMHAQGLPIAEPLSIPFTLPIITLPVTFGLMAAWSRGGAPRALAIVAAAALLVVTATQWDQRSAWARYVESVRPGSHPFAALIPPGAQVYWYEDTVAAWILLQRPNFISQNQVSGLLFNRDTALLAMERGPALLSVMGNQAKCSSLEMVGAQSLDRESCAFPRDNFLKLCALKPTHPDFLIAPVDVGTGVVSRWQFTPRDGSQPIAYALYDCSKIR
jgi:hypothetical protein